MWLENATQELILAIVTLATALLIYYKWSFGYWKRKGLPYIEPSFPFGNIGQIITGSKILSEIWEEQYNTLKRRNLKHGGLYVITSPHYMPIDPEIIKLILTSDFSNFMNHSVVIDANVDPLQKGLLFLKDAEWKNLRSKLTPTFTSGKMKTMFTTLKNCVNDLKYILENAAISEGEVNIKMNLQRFTMDVISSVAFGIDSNCLKDSNSEFFKFGRKAVNFDLIDNIKLVLTLGLPQKVLDFLKIKFTKNDVEKFYMDLVEEVVNFREKNNVYRSDFMHLLIQLKNRGGVFDDQILKNSNTNQKGGLTMNEVGAQAFFFILAGFETSASTLTFASFELAQRQDIQNKAREEINKVLEKHNGELTYEALAEMKYLEQIVYETLRKYPPIPNIDRVCNKNYKIPGTDIILEKGTAVDISMHGLHHDPDYYPDPDKFDPMRFTEENKASRPTYTWIPFGDGPRACIGMRFAIMQVKMGLLTLLKEFKINLSPKTKLPLKYDTNFILNPKEDIIIDISKV